MDPSAINYPAVFVSAGIAFLVGGLWYSPLAFGKAWAAEVGLSEEELKTGNPVRIFGGSFFLALIMSFNLAAFLGPEVDLGFGTLAGFLTGLGWVAAAFGITYLFERRSMRVFLINAGYHVVTLTAMGLVLSAWR